MKQKAIAIAQKLLNLYRQNHVILGGWGVLNPIFITDCENEFVIPELRKLPTGNLLATHIENLRAGKTPMDSIAPELLPYGGLMSSGVASIKLTDSEMRELSDALNSFTTDADGLEKIQSLDVVKKFGEEWITGIKKALSNSIELSAEWDKVIQTARAYELWKIATDIQSTPISERGRAAIQAELPEFETYLPMFGDTGTELLTKLRAYVSA